MPIFEYVCRNCSKSFEKLVLSREIEPLVCPHCGSPRVEQKFSAFSTSTATASTARSCAPSGGG